MSCQKKEKIFVSKSFFMKIIVIGGGAAGFFAAITAAELLNAATEGGKSGNNLHEVIILERGKDILQKVKVSGGGRCNVTHACFIPKDLVKNYPRGEKALLSPFNRFSPADTIEWFKKRGVRLKTEEDGRMFPITDDSQTIINCLYQAATRAGVKILRGYRVEDIVYKSPLSGAGSWQITTNQGEMKADKVMIATGSATAIWDILKKLGHTIVKPVPSLFTFNIVDKRLKNLEGISVPLAHITVENAGKLAAEGPLLITHWGLSGPAVLKLSAWGARILYDKNYDFKIKVNWTGHYNINEIKDLLTDCKINFNKKMVINTPQLIPSRLWESLVEASEINNETRWADISKKQMQNLAEQLTQCPFHVTGKSTFKEEFVTAGGVDLDEVNFKTFESKTHKNLFFAGEILDIDAITGGFNFQAAWTGGWIAGQAMAIEVDAPEP